MNNYILYNQLVNVNIHRKIIFDISMIYMLYFGIILDRTYFGIPFRSRFEKTPTTGSRSGSRIGRRA